MCVFAIKPQPWMLDFPNVTRSRSTRCASATRSRTPTPSSIIAPARDAASIAAAATAPVVRRASAAARSASHASGVNTRDSIGNDAPSATAGSAVPGLREPRLRASPPSCDRSSSSPPPNPARANPPRLFPPRLRSLAPRTTYGTSSTNARLPLTARGPPSIRAAPPPCVPFRLPIGSSLRYISSSSSSKPLCFIFRNLARFGPKRASRRGARGAETATPKPVSHLPTGIVRCPSRSTRTEAFHFFAWPIPQCISHLLGSIKSFVPSEGSAKVSVAPSAPAAVFAASRASAHAEHRHRINPVRGW